MPRRKLRMFWTALWTVLIGLLAWWTLLYFAQTWMLFPRQVAGPGRATKPDYVAEVWTVELEGGGAVEAWYAPAPGDSPASGNAPAVVFFHGNAELIDYQDDIVAAYHALGMHVLLPEYRGYARSAGSPSQAGLHEDMTRFFERLAARPEVDKARIVFHGRSIGGATAADLARTHPPAAFIGISLFDSIPAMSRYYLAPGFLARHPFRNDRALAGGAFPVLLFHGADDEVVPIARGRALRDRIDADRLTWVEYDCTHNDFPGVGNERDYWRRVVEFLRARGVVDQP